MMYSGWFFFYLLFLVFSCIPYISAKSLRALMHPEELDLLRESNIGQFIKKLGIPHHGLCHATEDDDDIPPMLNSDLPFGDLLMDEEIKEESKEDFDRNNIEEDFASDGDKEDGKETKSSTRKWKNGIIPYYISKNDYTDSEREIIENAINLMNSRLSRVYFRPYKHLQDENYAHIFSGKGCYAKLGMAGGSQPVSLQASKCLATGIIQHELMHVTGFGHEQNRPDRDDYVKILFSSIPEKWWNEYKRKNPKQAAFVGNYDYYSAMHYPTVSPGDLSKTALKILDPDVDPEDVGNRPKLSIKDVEKIDVYYS